VIEKPKRRRFTAEDKQRILELADACKEPGEQGALLRREGLYSSHLSAWRAQRKKGLRPKKRGRKGKTPEQQRVADLEKENSRLLREKAKLEAKLKKADMIIAFQKKVAALLEIPLNLPESDESDS
jgi:transposase-like protein